MPSRFTLGRPISTLRVYDTSYSDNAKKHRLCLRRMEILWDSFPGLLPSTVLKRKKESLVLSLDVYDLYTHRTLKPPLLKYGSIETTQSLSGKQILSELGYEKQKGKFWMADKIGPGSSSTLCFSKVYLLSLYKNLALQVQQFTCIRRSPGTRILTANSGCNVTLQTYLQAAGIYPRSACQHKQWNSMFQHTVIWDHWGLHRTDC